MIRISAVILLAALTLGAEMKVGTNEGVRAAVKKVQPEYNPVAKQMRVQGDVEVEAQVDDKGDVKEVKVVSGNALLTGGVVKAVKEWKFTPFSDAGKNVPALVSLRFSFKL
ncbi:MAG: energy transducer TonB [Bryobacterales bacterium]|nr:energy transducer TonB [Bryobacterales bacterium]